jgi:hypothetical protein
MAVLKARYQRAAELGDLGVSRAPAPEPHMSLRPFGPLDALCAT